MLNSTPSPVASHDESFSCCGLWAKRAERSVACVYLSVTISRAGVVFEQFIDGFLQAIIRVHQIKRLIYFRQNQLLLHQYVEEEQIHKWYN